MEILDLRQLRATDLEPLLEEEKQVWQDRLQWDYSATAALVLRFVEARALAGYAAVEGRRAIGYSFFVYEDHKGLIGDVFVSGSFRDGATETSLLLHGIETLQATPGIRRIEAQLLHVADESVRQCFLSHAFQHYPRQFLIRSLPEDLPLVPPCDAGIEIVRWNARYFSEAARLIARAYQGHVDSAISEQYRSPAGATQFLENLVHYPGCGVFYPEGSFLAFQDAPPSLCGMILTSTVRDRVAHITQLCVEPESQRRGIASRLMDRALRTLGEKGFRAVTLTVTTSNSPALHFYRRLGFSNLSHFDAFAWETTDEVGDLSPPRLRGRS